MTTFARAAIASVEDTGRAVQVAWTSGETSRFLYVWLRDCCYCEECGDCYSSLRIYVPDMASLKARPESVVLNDDTVDVVWQDGHRSAYRADWLFENRYDDAARAARRLTPALWDASLDPVDVTHDFQTASGSDEGRLALLRTLDSHGICIVRNGPSEPGSVKNFAEIAGDVVQLTYGAIFDLTPANKIGTAGTLFRDVPPHSDEPFAYSPPGIEALACVHPAEDGGATVLVDGFAIAEKLKAQSPEGFNLLATWSHSHIRRHEGSLDQRSRAPILALDDDGELSGIRFHTRASAPQDLPESVMEPYLDAYHRLAHLMMQPENQIQIRLDAGDAVVFDNHRALHARTAFTDRRRHMQICGVMRESAHENYRLLSARLGRSGEAGRVFRAGACR